jgi:invasion protein IalB
MISLSRFAVRAFAVAALAFSTAAAAQDDAQAQQQQQQQARKAMTPTVMKTFSGWDVRCYPVQTPAPCDMWEAIAFKKGGSLAISVSIVYVPSRDQHLMQFVVPLGIDLQQGAKATGGGYSSSTLSYHHCDRIGCYIILPQANDLVSALRGQSTFKVRVVQFHGKPVDLTVPLKGFGEAHTALVDLAKQKTAGNNAAAPAQDEPTAPANP